MNRLCAAIRARIEKSPLAHRLLGGTVWNVGGTVASSGLTLVTMTFVARLLGKPVYGKFIVLQSTLVMVGVFASFGIGLTATRYLAELRVRDAGRLAHILALTERAALVSGMIASAVLAALSGPAATFVLNSADLAIPLLIASPAVLFASMDTYNKSVLSGFEAMRELAIGTLLGTLPALPVMFFAARAYGLKGLAGAMVFGALLQMLISKVQADRLLRRFSITKRPEGCWREWHVLRDFAFPALLSGIAVPPAHWLCQALLANTPGGYAELALLGIAMQWFNMVLFLPNSASRCLLPVLTEHFASGDYSRTARVLKLAVISNLAAALPFSLLIALLSPWILSLYGSQFSAGAQSLALLAGIAVLVTGAMPVGQLLAIGERMWMGAIMNFGWALVYMGSASVLSKYGAFGIVCSLGIAYVVHSVWVVFYAFNHMTVLRPDPGNQAFTTLE